MGTTTQLPPGLFEVRLEQTEACPVWLLTRRDWTTVLGYHIAAAPARMTGGVVRPELDIRDAYGVSLIERPRPLSAAAAAGPLTVAGLGPVTVLPCTGYSTVPGVP